MGCIFDQLFQSFIRSVILSINSLPTFPYGTRKVFFRHFEISLYASSMVDELTVLVLPSLVIVMNMMMMIILIIIIIVKNLYSILIKKTYVQCFT